MKTLLYALSLVILLGAAGCEDLPDPQSPEPPRESTPRWPWNDNLNGQNDPYDPLGRWPMCRSLTAHFGITVRDSATGEGIAGASVVTPHEILISDQSGLAHVVRRYHCIPSDFRLVSCDLLIQSVSAVGYRVEDFGGTAKRLRADSSNGWHANLTVDLSEMVVQLDPGPSHSP